jgi:serine/threonine-protein kinase
MASHFNGGGKPNGWMSKDFFFVFEGALLLLIIGISFLLPVLLQKTPYNWVNLPNKDYWLDKERSAETFDKISNYQNWFSVALLILFIAVNQLVFKANLEKIPLPSFPMWTILLLFFAFVIIWLIFYLRQFRIPK